MKRFDLPTALAELAVAQLGLLRRSDLEAYGFDDRAIRACLKDRLLRRVIHGVYAMSPMPQDGDALLLERTHALLLSNASIVASHASAVLLYGLPVFDVHDDRATGLWLNGAPGRATREVRIRRWRRPLPEDLPPELPRRVPLGLALVQHAMDSGVVAGLAAMDAALNRELVTRAEVGAALETSTGLKGCRRAEAALLRSDAGAESVGETRTRLVLNDLGYQLDTQFLVRAPSGSIIARADGRIIGTNVLVEFDGLMKYEGAAGRAELQREKHRENQIRALGWTVVRLTWADLASPERVRAKIDAAIRASVRSPLSPGA